MRIGIDAVTVLPGRTGGIETYTIELVRALAQLEGDHELVVFAQPGLAPALEPLPPRVRFVELARSSRSLGEAFGAQLAWVPEAARGERISLLHHMKNYACAAAVPRVLTLHDMFPEYFLRTEPERDGAVNLVRATLMGASARSVDAVVTVSADAADTIARVTGIARSSIVVTPLAPRRLPVTAEGGLPGAAHFLALGKLARYKNIPRLLRAFARARTRRRLVLVGTPAFRGDAVAREVDALVRGSGGRIVALGHVSEPELARLYTGARALLFPSLIEGFGLPPLEAAALGTPVALSDIAVHREVLGDAALCFDPRDEGAITAAIERLDQDDALCRQLSERGRLRSAAFNWAETARRTLAVYESLAR